MSRLVVGGYGWFLEYTSRVIPVQILEAMGANTPDIIRAEFDLVELNRHTVCFTCNAFSSCM